MSYYAPWSGPNRTAYAAADSLADILFGRRRHRHRDIVLVPVSVVADLPCVHCEVPLGDPYVAGGTEAHDTRNARVWHVPAKLSPTERPLLFGAHYYCGWTNLLSTVVRAHSPEELGDPHAALNPTPLQAWIVATDEAARSLKDHLKKEARK